MIVFSCLIIILVIIVTISFGCAFLPLRQKKQLFISPNTDSIPLHKKDLFDGMFINHTFNIMGMEGPSTFEYTQGPGTLFHVVWNTSVMGTSSWDVDTQNRVMSNVVGGFAPGIYTPAWIFTNISIGDSVLIAVDGEGDHIFNVSSETTTILPKFGLVNVWVLEDLTTPGGAAWYEQTTGILLNGTFFFGGSFSYTFEFVDTNTNFIANSYAPTLTGGVVEPNAGNQITPFNFSIIYSDFDNNPPEFINVLINGTPFPLEPQDPLDTNYTNGGLFQVLVYLQPGTYSYSFECGDGKYSNSTQVYTGLIVSASANLNSPSLQNGRVLPSWGYNRTTVFNFEVNYTDADNNPPEYLIVTVNASDYQMQEINPIDTNFMDGKIYRASIQLAKVGNYTFLFNCSDGTNLVTLGPFSGPIVKNLVHFNGMYITHNFTIPSVGSGVSNVTYTRISGDLFSVWWNPTIIAVSFWLVNVTNRLITNATGDGVFENNTHTPFWIYPNVELGDTVPIAVAGEGDHLFNVTQEISFIIPGFGAVKVLELLDLTLPGGVAWYEKSTGILLKGTFFFGGGINNYSFDFIDTNVNFSYLANNFSPVLSLGQVTPSSGDQLTPFNFSVIYTDFDNDAPQFINVLLNGTPVPMSPQNPLDNNYTDGCLYQLVTYLLPGNYNYSFNCGDWKYSNATGWYSLFVNESNNFSPQLLNAQVAPASGVNTTLFNYTVWYYDADNNWPTYLNLTINATTYPMLPVNPLDMNVTDGALFYYETTLNWGLYQFQISCSDGRFSNSTDWHVGPMVNPLLDIGSTYIHFRDDFEGGLSQWNSVTGLWHLTDDTSAWPDPYHSPTHSMWFGQEITGNYDTGTRVTGELVTRPIDLSGVSTAYLEFYHWRAGEMGFDFSYVNITTNGILWTTLYQTDAQIAPWAFQTINLSNYCGNSTVQLSFYFDTQDPINNNYRGWLIDDITIYSPQKTLTLLSPNNGSTIFSGLQNFTWNSLNVPYLTINYTLQISNTTNFMPILLEKSDIPETAGITMTPILIDLPSGQYYWRVRPEYYPFLGNWSDYFRFNLIQNNFTPILTNGIVQPSSGNQFTEFNFSVYYIDQDNNPPISINITIDGISYPMGKQNSSDNNYVDGCVYNYSLILAPGLYNYSFQCSDGKFYVNSSLYTGLNVTEVNFNPPILNNGQVSPTLGYNASTVFVFTVNYSDSDNNAPLYVNVTINSTTYLMTQQNPLDTDYRDGALFIYSSTLPDVGKYSYYFNCSDGFSASIGPYSDLTVQRAIFWNQTSLQGVRIGTVVAHGEDNPRTIYPIIVNELIQRGAKITDITTPINATILYNYEILWFDEYGAAMTPTEIDAIQQWVQNGGRFLITGDNMGSAIGLVNRFNISYGGAPSSGTTNLIYFHPITFGVTQVNFPSPVVSLDLSAQSQAIPCVKLNTYDMVTAMNYGEGKIVIIVDENVLTSYTMADNHLLINNTFGWLGDIINNYAPNLTGGTVSPLGGDQTVLFNFTVTYTDLDNNPPHTIAVILNGTPHTMVKQDPSDFNWSDGCLYQFTTYLAPGSYYFWFNCSDGIHINTTQLFTGLSVTGVNLNPPLLINGQVNPAVGFENSTIFTFTVNYTDADNNPPLYVNITIDSTTYPMVQQNPLDNNYMDGAIFSFATTLEYGTYSFMFNCSDGTYLASDGPYSGLTVEENPLKNYTLIADYTYQWLDATLGVRATLAGQDDGYQLFALPFNFTFYNETFDFIYVCTNGFASFTPIFQYSNVPFPTSTYYYMIAPFWDDLRAETPCNIFVRNMTAPNRVVIEWQDYYTLGGTLVGTFEIVLFESGDIIFNYDYLNYALSYTCGLNFGPDTRYFSAYSLLNTSMDNFSILFTKQENKNAPTLTGGMVVPLQGNQTTLFNFSVIYTDLDNNSPQYIKVFLNGNSFPMSPQNPLDVNYTDGCLFQLTITLQPGTYNYSFQCSDGKYSNSSATYFGLNVTEINLNAPTLNGGQVTPSIGYNGTTLFTFSVNYSDADNNPPQYVNVTVNTTTYLMIKQNPLDTNYMDGCIYAVTMVLNEPGSYLYSFTCADNNFSANLGPYSGPLVRKPQLFDGLYMDYNFTSSIGPTGPSHFGYTHFSGPLFNVTWSSPLMAGTWQVDLFTRLISSSTTGFAAGTHTPAWIFVNVTLGDLIPISILFESDHTFNVSGELQAYLPGFGRVEVWVLTDLTTPGGIAWYEKSTGIFLNGTFIFLSTESYSFNLVDTNAEFAYIPNIYQPTLTGGAVIPASGNQSTLFNFSIIYTDLDNNFPVYINVLVNGTPYPMVKQNLADNNYTDGCLYQTLIYLQPGTYSYSFECADWDYYNSTGTYSGLTITKQGSNPPILSNGRVIPSSGYKRGWFTFLVNYSDQDNDAPSFINVTINQTTYSMLKQDILDTNYMDGCAYYVPLRLTETGNFTFHFNCSDGDFFSSIGPFSGPTVLEGPLFDGMFMKYLMTDSMAGSFPTFFNYTYIAGTHFQCLWEIESIISSTWEVDVQNRLMQNSTGGFGNNVHTPVWIFTNVTLFDTVLISVDGEGDHLFNITAESIYYLPGHGCIEVWILTDLTTPGGVAWYEKSTGILLNGTFYYGGGIYYTFSFQDTNVEFTYVSNYLESGNVLPLQGSASISYNFTVIYYNADNLPPTNIQVLLDSVAYEMTKINSADLNYTDGVMYQYVNSSMAPGNHRYIFMATVGGEILQYPSSGNPLFGPIVTSYEFNMLFGGQVSPIVGNETALYRYSVIYQDTLNNSPSWIQVYIDEQPYNMTRDPFDVDFTNGVEYFYENGSLLPVLHTFYFEAYNGTSVLRFPEVGVLIGPRIIIKNYRSSFTESTPVIDGIFNVTEWNGAFHFSTQLQLYDLMNSTIPIKILNISVWIMNNGMNIFFCIILENETYNDAAMGDLLAFFFDDNLNQILDENEQGWMIQTDPTQNYYLTHDACFSGGMYQPDILVGGTEDGASAFTHTNMINGMLGTYIFETSIPFGSADVHDLQLPNGSQFGLKIVYIDYTTMLFGILPFINTPLEYIDPSTYATVSLAMPDIQPTSTHPADLVILQNSTNITITWRLQTKQDIGAYQVLLNGTPLQNWQPWPGNNTDIIIPVNTTEVGVWSYLIQYNDSEGVWGISDEVLVIVEDYPWILTAPNNIMLLQNTTGNFLAWTLADRIGAGIYSIYINDSPYLIAMPWINATSLNVPIDTTRGLGPFNYTIRYWDSNGFEGVPDNVIVTINDIPIVLGGESMNNTYIFRNATGYTINWTIFDSWGAAGMWRILINSSLYLNWTGWTSGVSFTVPIDTNRGIALFDYTLQFQDNFGAFGEATHNLIYIIDFDAIAPFGNISYPLGNNSVQRGSNISIAGYANGTGSPITRIMINMTAFSLQTSPIGQLFGYYKFINNSYLADGKWNVRVLIEDMGGQSINLTITFYIDNTPPPAIPGFMLEKSNQSVLLTWAPVSDLTNVTYMIFRNGINIANTTTTAYYDLNLAPGTYIYGICAIDGAGNRGEQIFLSIIIEAPPGGDITLIIILIIVIGSVGIVSFMVIVRRQKRVPPKEKEKIKKAITHEVLAPEAKTGEIEIIPTEHVKAATTEKEKDEIKDEKVDETKSQIREELAPKEFKVEFYCHTCNKYSPILTPQLSVKYSCLECGSLLQRVVKCPQCNKKLSFEQDSFSTNLGKLINCPQCHQDFVLTEGPTTPELINQDLSLEVERLKEAKMALEPIKKEEVGIVEKKRETPYLELDPEKFICPICFIHYTIEQPTLNQIYKCHVCDTTLNRLLICKTCQYQQQFNPTEYAKYTEQKITCPSCKKKHDEEELAQILTRLRSKNPETRLLAAELLGEIGNKMAGPFLIDVLLHDPNNTVRGMAAIALGMIGITTALPALYNIVEKEEDKELRDCATKAIKWLKSKMTNE